MIDIFLIYTAVYIFFVLNDTIPISKNRQWKVLVIYCVLMAAAYTFSVMIVLGAVLPSPAGPLKQLVMSITGKLGL